MSAANEEEAKEALKKLQNKTESRVLFQNHIISVALAIFLVTIGLPVWWKATETHRAALPYSEIDLLAQARLPVNFTVDILNFDIGLAERANALKTQVLKVLREKGTSDRLLFEPNVLFDTYTARKQDLRTCTSPYDLRERFPDKFREKFNGFGVKVILGEISSFPEWAVNEYTVADAVFVESLSGPDQTAERIVEALDSRVLGMGNVRMALGLPGDRSGYLPYQSSPAYDITLSLAVCDPSKVKVRWNSEEAIKLYLDPMLAPLRKFISVNVASQTLSYLDLQTDFVALGKTELTIDKLPLVRNQVESRLYSFVSNSPQIQLIVYIPCGSDKVVTLVDDSGTKVATNAFVAPRWGGILFYDKFDGNKKDEVVVDNEAVMQVFGSQILELLGFDLATEDSNAIAHIAFQKWLFWRAVENIATSRQTLSSLVELLDKVKNMVISEEIAFQVAQSVDCMQAAIVHLKEGDFEQAFVQSRQAFAFSERAFFDPSLLGLLYFPDDQKFAIYIPLFLPVGLPLVMSVFSAVKWFKSQTSAKAKAD